MREKWHGLVLVVFLAGIGLAGLAGTSANMTFIWPAYGTVGLAAVLSVGLLFMGVSYPLPWAAGGVLLLLFGYLVARASSSPVAYFAREDAALAVGAFLVYGLSLVLLLSVAARRRLVDLLASLTVLNLLFGLAQATVSPTLWVLPGYERTFAERAGGLFNHPDHFAGFLAMLVPLWISMACFSRRSRLWRTGAAVLAAVSAIGVLASGSGAGVLGLLAGLLAFAATGGALLWGRLPEATRRVLFRNGTVAALLCGIVIAAAAIPIARALDRSLLEKGGRLSLLQVWKAGWDQFEAAPLLGTGSRTSYIYGRRFRSETLDSSATDPEFVHNEYLQTAADYGLVGLALVLLSAFLHLVSGFRFARAYLGFAAAPGSLVPRSDHLALVLGALGSILSLAVLACFDFVLHLPVFAMVAAAFLAILAAPDPMANALVAKRTPQWIPGGGTLFAGRSLLFGCGIATAFLGAVFTRSEFHYERARLAFEAERGGFHHLRHLHAARALDPKNPFIFSLSAHSQIAGMQPDMAEPARIHALGQADAYFSHARELYPQDLFAAIGHAAVLEELDRPGEALERLREAREFAPHYGNLMLAEAEHHLRHGRVGDAEGLFAEAMNAAAYRDTAAAQRGLLTVTEWKLIAEQDGIDWRVMPDPVESEPLLAGPAGYRSLPEARIESRQLAGKAAEAGENAAAPAPGTTGDPGGGEGSAK